MFMNRMQQAWQGKKVAGALLMDVKSAFNNVSRPILSRRLGELGIEPDLVRWTDSFMSDRKVRLVLEGREGGGMRWKRGSHRDPQWRRYCSRATFWVFDYVEGACPGRDFHLWTMWHGGRRESRKNKLRGC